MQDNLILDVDSYKTSHEWQYPPEVAMVRSYVEPRFISPKLEEALGMPAKDIKIVNFGMSMYAQYLQSTRINMGDINEADELFRAHGVPFNREGWEYVFYKHDGFMPVRIKALPEGALIDPGTVQAQVSNYGGKQTRWCTSYIETSMLRALWYPTTVATISYNMRRIIKEYMEKTCDNLDKLPFMLHDFGARGVSSKQSAGIGGVAHLTSFMGTDTVEAIRYARQFYAADMAGFSIPAAEHSTITSWGADREAEAYRNMVTQFGGPGKLLAVVSDSYDIRRACSEIWGEQLIDDVRNCGGTVVVRPDSGDPATVVSDCLDILSDKFGYTLNTKGFKCLPDCVRIIQGDGINGASVRRILAESTRRGYSTDNLAFGMGGALLQQCDRDWLGYAMKCNEVYDGVNYIPISKDPVTDSSKKSKAGKQRVEWIAGQGFKSFKDQDFGIGGRDWLELVYDRGYTHAHMNNPTLDSVRKNINWYENYFDNINKT